MDASVVYDVVEKLIGNPHPCGETQADDKRFDNLCQLIELTELLIKDIQDVKKLNCNAREASRIKASRTASRYLDGLAEALQECMEL